MLALIRLTIFLMIALVIKLALALLAAPAHAQPVAAGLHLATHHHQQPARGDRYRDDTPGLYVRFASGLTLGAYRNSEGRPSLYAAATLATADETWAITLGGVTGYRRGALAPLVVPSVRVPVSRTLAVRLAYLPKPGAQGASGVHLALELGL